MRSAEAVLSVSPACVAHPPTGIGEAEPISKQQRRIVHGAVDIHLDVHVAAVIDGAGRLLAIKSLPTSPLDLRQLDRRLGDLPPTTPSTQAR